MMRLPWFDYRAPRSLDEAARMLAGEGPRAMLLAGGTDLLPNMKRRQHTPATLIALRRVEQLNTVSNGGGLALGAGLTLTQVVAMPQLRDQYAALARAAAYVASPHLRNMATLGGNLCLDTRCDYYDQSHEWRQAIGYCLKKDGATCWVATASKRCLAVSSTDTAPALIALGATATLVSAAGRREVAVEDLYQDDGIEYLTRRPDEILTEVKLPAAGWKSTYWKLRRRGSVDFPVLGVAAAVKLAGDGTVEAARIALGAVASRPFLVPRAGEILVGKRLSDDAIGEAAATAWARAKPMDNADLDLHWRKRVVPDFTTYALRELRGDDVRAIRHRIARAIHDP